MSQKNTKLSREKKSSKILHKFTPTWSQSLSFCFSCFFHPRLGIFFPLRLLCPLIASGWLNHPRTKSNILDQNPKFLSNFQNRREFSIFISRHEIFKRQLLLFHGPFCKHSAELSVLDAGAWFSVNDVERKFKQHLAKN